MSDGPSHGARAKRAENGGGAAKWLLVGAAALVVLGGAYFVWKSSGPAPDSTQAAYDDPYAEEPQRADAAGLAQGAIADGAATDAGVAPAASNETPPAARPQRRARAPVVAEATIGVTPASETAASGEAAVDSDEVVVTGVRRPIWARVPSAQRLSEYYPERLRERGREGEARLTCTVLDNGALDCERVSESSAGFGAAALRVSRTLRHARQLQDGTAAAGTAVNLRVVFRMEDERRRRG